MTDKRRENILSTLKSATDAISASTLAKQMNVSRQVIVGDVALLRAQGHDILSTHRGYILDQHPGSSGNVFKVACTHSREQAGEELYAIVDNGGKVLDVIVEHPMYGQLTGVLNIESRFDVDLFLENVEKGQVSLLSNLTDGVHLHTVLCSDKETESRIKQVLQNINVLLVEN